MVAGHHGPALAGGGNLPRRRLAQGRAWPAAAAGGGIGAVAEAAWRGQPQRPAQARAAVARGRVAARAVPAPVVFVATAQLSSGRRFSGAWRLRSEEHTSELQSLMRISYAVICLKKKKTIT